MEYLLVAELRDNAKATFAGEAVPRKWLTLRHPSTSDAARGEVQVMIELVPKSLAKKRPVGLGREEPNAHPELPPPEGREKFSPFSPLSALKALVGPKLYSQMCGMIYCVAIVMCCWFMLPMVGSQYIADTLMGDGPLAAEVGLDDGA